MFKTITLIAILCVTVFTQTKTNSERPTGSRTFTATAYSIYGKTASGIITRPGIIAADPKILPLGTIIFIQDMGVFLVADTGKAIFGNRIDIYMKTRYNAIKFGRKKIQLKIITYRTPTKVKH